MKFQTSLENRLPSTTTLPKEVAVDTCVEELSVLLFRR
jgi:hypothetical protein